MLKVVSRVKTNKKAKDTFNYNRNSTHESAHKHVTGSARYVDDLAMPEGTLHAYLGLANCAHGLITSLDLDSIRGVPGVKDVFTANAIPGVNDISPTGSMDEPILADKKVLFNPSFAFKNSINLSMLIALLPLGRILSSSSLICSLRYPFKKQ